MSIRERETNLLNGENVEKSPEETSPRPEPLFDSDPREAVRVVIMSLLSKEMSSAPKRRIPI